MITLHSAHWSAPFVEAMRDRATEDALKDLSDEQRKSAVITCRGKVFYFRPGHEIYPVYKQELPLRVIENACGWLARENNDV